MHESVMAFIRSIPKVVYAGKSVLEVGSCNVNGSVREIIQSHAAEYIGVDIAPGPGVDEVVDAENLLSTFGERQFDVVVSTEMLEHVENYFSVAYNISEVLDFGGFLILTTRAPGFPFHNPPDRWRFTPGNIAELLSAPLPFNLQLLGSDPQVPGVFAVAQRVQHRTFPSASSIKDLLADPAYPVFAEFAAEAEKIRQGK